MSPIALADIEMAARVLMLLAPNAREDAMRQLLRQTQEAARFRQAHRTQHPRFGSGSLLSCASLRQTAPRPPALAANALDAYAVVIKALLADPSHHGS